MMETTPAGQSPPLLPGELPRVLVQIPVYNEPLVVERALCAGRCVGLAARRLKIQLLDDSTDITSDIAVHVVARLRREGADIDHVRRPDRSGFKGGALAAGMALCDAPYVAVFDADFMPSPDWLRGPCAMLADSKAAFVQTRIEWATASKTG